MRRNTVLICLDGLDPEYLAWASTPSFDEIARRGFGQIGQSVMPSVTNVNNVSILTADFPECHGIATNYRYDPQTDTGEMIETSDHLRAPTILESAASKGLRTALLVSKVKLLELLRRGTEIAQSAERPDGEWIDAIGPAESIYSAQIDYWLMRALRRLLREYNPDLVYVSTTDYMMHMHAPDSAEAIAHIENLDRLLGDVLNDHPDHQILLTADHGMGAKTEALDLQLLLAQQGLRALFVPVIKDRYVVHHSNMGGSGYLYTPDGDSRSMLEATLTIPGVEEVYEREEAAHRFHLPGDLIGDLFVLADEHRVFAEAGSIAAPRVPVSIRSHGSRYEADVPIYGLNPSAPADRYAWNLDIARNLEI